MEFSIGNIIQIAIYLVTFGSFAGTILTRLNNLEKKVDKHNNVIERMYKCEESIKSAHHRIDELRGSLK
jgi:hypothetical protein